MTGKISDFAGLFAFPYFFSSLFPKKIKSIYIFTGFLFLFWKSDYSQPVFNFVQSYGLGIERTVDYSDLISLLILPISYLYWNSDFKQILNLRRTFKPIIIFICCFAFIATTLPKKEGKINIKSDYETNVMVSLENAKKLELYDSFYKKNTYKSKLHIPKYNAQINISLIINEKDNGYLNIKLDSIISYGVEGSMTPFIGGIDEDDVDYIESLSLSDFEILFIKQKIRPLRKK